MNTDPLDGYLARLRRELRKRGVLDARIVEEARGHLLDAIDHARRDGLPDDLATRRTFDRFGEPAAVAADFAEERFRMLNRLVLVAAAAVGWSIAYVDSRPGWDATGITAFSMLIAAGAFTLVRPQRPWLVAVAVGIWIPALAIARAPTRASFLMLIVLAFPLVGAYLGAAMRRVIPRT